MLSNFVDQDQRVTRPGQSDTYNAVVNNYYSDESIVRRMPLQLVAAVYSAAYSRISN